MLRKAVSWRYLTLRRALLSALIVLGGWGVASSLYQVKQSWTEYARNRDLVAWARSGGQLIMLAQHLAYERGRTAVVLRSSNPISNVDRQFLDERRKLVEPIVAFLSERATLLHDGTHRDFQAQWQTLQDCRRQVDAQAALTLHRRDPALLGRWMQEVNAFLARTEGLAHKLIRHYRQTEGASRLGTLGFLSYRLRMTTGSEASLIAQQVATGKPMSVQEIHAVYEMRGTQKAQWQELNRTLDFLGDPEMVVIANDLRRHLGILRSLQDPALAAWGKGLSAKVQVDALTAASVPLLDGFSNLMSHAIKQANRSAKEKMETAQRHLLSHIAQAISVLLVMLLAIFYVLAKVVKPLEAVDAQLRSLHYGGEMPAPQPGPKRVNEVERLRETTVMLERVFAEKQQLENQLRNLAFFDPMTQLPNRRLMEDRLRQTILRAKRQQTLLALLFIDLDDFKPVNDAFGHEAGDRVLRVVAERIASCLRESDTVSRHGGDEFIVLLPDLHTEHAAIEVAEKIRDVLSQPFAMTDAEERHISCSIGIAIYPSHSDNEAELIRLGDAAMYAAKQNGGNRIQMARTSRNEKK